MERTRRPDSLRDLGRAIRDRRADLGISQEEAALRAGMDRAYFGRIERGEGKPSVEAVFYIARGLDLEPWELVRDAERRGG